MSFKRSDKTCASSVGGPGLNFEEQIAGKSIFGTVNFSSANVHARYLVLRDAPRKPCSGVSRSGSAISALTPHMIVVSPRRTKEEPFAVDIDPTASMPM